MTETIAGVVGAVLAIVGGYWFQANVLEFQRRYEGTTTSRDRLVGRTKPRRFPMYGSTAAP